MTRWRLTVEYDGGPFLGWQRQDQGPTIQSTIEAAILHITGETTTVHGAGRTDAGVHALAMEAHADIAKPLTAQRLREGLNALVRPAPVTILSAEPVAADSSHCSSSEPPQRTRVICHGSAAPATSNDKQLATNGRSRIAPT